MIQIMQRMSTEWDWIKLEIIIKTEKYLENPKYLETK